VGHADGHVSVRLSPPQLAKLDALAERGGVSRSQVIRRLIDAAGGDVPVPSERLTREEALDLLHEQARSGRTAAISEVLRRQEAEDPRARALAVFEAMARERQPS
jgi:hypothetical protein